MGNGALLMRKQVGWSFFEDGTTIPNDCVPNFVRANVGVEVNRGQSYKIKLVMEGTIFEASLHNLNRKNATSDILQIRYDSNEDFKERLRSIFRRSYEYLRSDRAEQAALGKKKIYSVVPLPLAEYMEFYATEEPFCYRVEVVPQDLQESEERKRETEEERLRLEERLARSLDIEELNRRARKALRIPVRYRNAATSFARDPYVAELTKRRANGVCQLCEQPAPFLDKNGQPYLETHHIVWLARGGEDTVENTVALCPNCHKKMHVLDLEEDVLRLTEVDNIAIREEGNAGER